MFIFFVRHNTKGFPLISPLCEYNTERSWLKESSQSYTCLKSSSRCVVKNGSNSSLGTVSLIILAKMSQSYSLFNGSICFQASWVRFCMFSSRLLHSFRMAFSLGCTVKISRKRMPVVTAIVTTNRRLVVSSSIPEPTPWLSTMFHIRYTPPATRQYSKAQSRRHRNCFDLFFLRMAVRRRISSHVALFSTMSTLAVEASSSKVRAATSTNFSL